MSKKLYPLPRSLSRKRHPLNQHFSTCQNILKIGLFMLIIPTLMISSTACTNQSEPNNNLPQPTSSSQASIDKEASPLKIAFIANTNDAQTKEHQRILTEYLHQALKRPISIEPAKDYNEAVDLLAEEKVQVARLGPLTYVEAKERNPQIEPIAAVINKSTGRPWYKSVIIANSTSGIKTIEDLKGKRLGFVSKLSTSGYMFAVVYLLEQGFNFDSDFASVQFFKSHPKTLAALLDNQVDAISIQLEMYNQEKANGKINDTYQVIWQSEPIPESPVVVSQKLPPKLIDELKEAFINTPIGMISADGIPSNGYTLVQDSDYHRVKQVKQQLDEQLGKTK